MMDPAALAELAAERVDWRYKGLPAAATGRTVGELVAARLNVFRDGFGTPLLVLDAAALEHNIGVVARFAAAHGLAHAPHGKTTMAPQILARQLARGAWGLTAATPVQLRMYREFGVRRVFLANELVDPAALSWAAAELAADPEFVLYCHVDAVAAVDLMQAALRDAGATRPLDVVVELGVPAGRTGCRNLAEARDVADAIAASPALRLVGVAGYEGPAPDVDGFLAGLRAAAADFDTAGRFAGTDEIVVSAGGSAHLTTVARHLGGAWSLSRPVLTLLRSGAYVTHDHGMYARISPLHDVLRPALRLWSRVLSRPEPGLALLDFGKRDASYDHGLPVPLSGRRPPDRRPGSVLDLSGCRVTALNDQHAFLDVPPGIDLEIGDLVECGLSHPCTVFDKWQLIPLVDASGTAVDYVRTFF